jgi:hypothetical protein
MDNVLAFLTPHPGGGVATSWPDAAIEIAFRLVSLFMVKVK